MQDFTYHFIHRDYTVMGGEVHLDIYDDRLVVTSPGGMYNGMLIQELDIADVSSERRNPILANVMAQLDYMEKRGSGLTRICNETKALDGYKEELKPVFKSTPTQFQTIIYAAADTHHVDVRAGALQEIVAHYAAHGIGFKTHTVGHLANQFIYRLLEKNVHC